MSGLPGAENVSSDLIGAACRARCVAEGVDPDLPCPGLGVEVPLGETWPAWRVRERGPSAAIAVYLARLMADGSPEDAG